MSTNRREKEGRPMRREGVGKRTTTYYYYYNYYSCYYYNNNNNNNTHVGSVTSYIATNTREEAGCCLFSWDHSANQPWPAQPVQPPSRIHDGGSYKNTELVDASLASNPKVWRHCVRTNVITRTPCTHCSSIACPMIHAAVWNMESPQDSAGPLLEALVEAAVIAYAVAWQSRTLRKPPSAPRTCCRYAARI
ncbi:hypothetical protein CCHR01_18333 [Colletotrichum chrysophilum]|uniref:Uncharacterized protein n=1 Tax=Colletotrichum chrysophilum TaxID=1836956 RepID=A0AAD9A0Y1_9PEZI|nr:hypothetical protein CCHR01_18333 [Colletotrichum chrysophilum]